MSTFCKIVLQQSLQDLKLMLPEEFVSKFERNLPDFAFFEPPNGWIWKLRLQKRNGDVYLSLRDDEESVDFASYYSLRQGNVIFFKYDGNANFGVQIFDVNGDEINYDPTFSTTTTSSVEENGNGRGLNKEGPLEKAVSIIHKCEASNCKNPFFVVGIQQGYIDAKYMYVPSTFVKKYLALAEFIYFVLETEDGRWTVVLKRNRKPSYHRFTIGWPKFRKTMTSSWVMFVSLSW